MSWSKQAHSGKWVPVKEIQGHTAAEVIASELRAANIPTEVWQEGVGNALGLSVGPLGTAYVMVPEEFAEEARMLIGGEDETDALPDGAEDAYAECPNCGAALELDDTELAQGWFVCPDCKEVINVIFKE